VVAAALRLIGSDEEQVGEDHRVLGDSDAIAGRVTYSPLRNANVGVRLSSTPDLIIEISMKDSGRS
jgi:hypothetical protein